MTFSQIDNRSKAQHVVHQSLVYLTLAFDDVKESSDLLTVLSGYKQALRSSNDTLILARVVLNLAVSLQELERRLNRDNVIKSVKAIEKAIRKIVEKASEKAIEKTVRTPTNLVLYTPRKDLVPKKSCLKGAVDSQPSASSSETREPSPVRANGAQRAREQSPTHKASVCPRFLGGVY